MNRRHFLGSITSVGAAGQSAGILAAQPTGPTALSSGPSRWPEEVYRRSSVDIHVPDWDPALLGRFDAAELVESLARGGVQSYLQYTNSHVGLCLWKTKVGKPHAAMKGRDFFGEVVAACRQRQIHPLAYFSLIHDNWAFEFHKDWRFHYPDREAHEFLGNLSAQRAVFEPFLGGNLLADVAIYFDKNSMYNPFENGVEVQKLAAVDSCSHRITLVGTARILQEAHLPFGVVTNISLDRLSRYRVVILPWVVEMTAAQAEVFRRFVAAGGTLYASGPSSVERLTVPKPRFLLEDVLGVRAIGTKNHSIFYLTPLEGGLRKAVWPQDHVSHRGTQVQVEVLPGSEVLARVTLPFVDPGIGRNIGSRFAAIHSNPPALKPGPEAAIVQHRFGNGQAIWTCCGLEGSEEWVDRQLVLALLRRILSSPCHFEVDAHPAVEMTLFHQPDKKRYLAGLLNLQQKLPQVPVPATVRVLPLPGRPFRHVRRLPDQKEVSVARVGPYAQFQVAPFDTLAMYLLEY